MAAPKVIRDFVRVYEPWARRHEPYSLMLLLVPAGAFVAIWLSLGFGLLLGLVIAAAIVAFAAALFVSASARNRRLRREGGRSFGGS
jgi:Flp pilus assembly protein TadB